MIAHRLRPLGWIAAVTIAAICFYLISSRVAAERGRLEATDARIVSIGRDIRRLQTELGARGSMRQLERWNGEVLALQAPTADQYRSEVQLASLQLGPQPTTPQIAQAAMVSAAPASKDVPIVEKAVELRKGRDSGPADPAGVAPPLLRTVAAMKIAKAPLSPPPARLQRVAMLDSGTLGDISRRAASEARDSSGR